MDRCQHVNSIRRPETLGTVYNPQMWICAECQTTESVWLCLCCGHAACGRYIHEHAVDHFKSTKHAVAMEINDGYTYCYICDDYVLNDNNSSDLSRLRCIVRAIMLQNFNPKNRLLRTRKGKGKESLSEADSVCLGNEDLQFTVVKHRSNLDDFRNFFFHNSPNKLKSPGSPSKSSTTQQRSDGRRRYPGLNGGSSVNSKASPGKSPRIQKGAKISANSSSLEQEIHTLFCAMWSGQQELVVPQGFLQAVWSTVPSFKGFRQQDAQEFLCEMLDRLTSELKDGNGVVKCNGPPAAKRRKFKEQLSESMERIPIIQNLFTGKLLSRVTCEACGHVSEQQENFLDLSLEFPYQFQSADGGLLPLGSVISKEDDPFASCHLRELLSAFTCEEELGVVYNCDNCNGVQRKQRRSEGSGVGKKYTPARKQLMVSKLPRVLRLHLKRFRWSGRCHREKISVHVQFDEYMDMKSFCSDSNGDLSALYRLNAVIIHHGRGFNSGHYTAYVWNSKSNFWLNCNDAKLEITSIEEVLGAQAYILFYTRVQDGESSFPDLLNSETPTKKAKRDSLPSTSDGPSPSTSTGRRSFRQSQNRSGTERYFLRHSM